MEMAALQIGFIRTVLDILRHLLSTAGPLRFFPFEKICDVTLHDSALLTVCGWDAHRPNNKFHDERIREIYDQVIVEVVTIPSSLLW